jgi:hypothetical protein
MAQNTLVVLIPNTPHLGNENNVQALTGSAKQAADYYISLRNMQTISWSLTTNFSGNIHIQASLDSEPSDTGNWATVYTIITTSSTSPVYDGYYNLQGNYVWLRAIVTNWTVGTIRQITASY